MERCKCYFPIQGGRKRGSEELPTKLYTKIITNRITDQLDSNQPAEQAGFRSNYSTNDHLQVVQQIMERYNEYAQPLCMAFIDYEKAFDCQYELCPKRTDITKHKQDICGNTQVYI